jgi:hypothetical protein
MTRDEIEAMSDAELTRAVAERVMVGMSLEYGHYWVGQQKWNPLADWNHAQLVVGATSLWDRSAREAFQSTLAQEWYADVDQRMILQTALMAVQPKETI